MDFKTYFRSLDASQKRKLAMRAETTANYLAQVACGYRKPSGDLVARIKDALVEVDLDLEQLGS